MDLLSSSPASDQTSPVTWHVIVWVLLSLAISSMSQPTGRLCNISIPRRYRLYTSISPIFCIADSVSILLSSLLTWYAFGTSPGTAVNCVNYYRLKRDTSEESDHIERPNPASWPRWVVFVIGTAPALVKLVSFSGLPWSRTWGLMYGVSYLMIECVNIISTCMSKELPDSISEALGYSQSAWESDRNRRTRRRAKDLEDALSVVNVIICVLAVLGQATLTAWALHDLLRIYANHDVQVTYDIHNAVQWFAGLIFLGIVATLAVSVLTRIIAHWRRSFPVLKLSKAKLPLTDTYQFMLATLVICPPAEPDPSGSHRKVTSIFPKSTQASLVRDTVTAATSIGYLTYRFWELLCSKAPYVGKALLVTRPVSITNAEDRNNTNDNTQEAITTEDRVDEIGVACLTFFSLHLFIGVFWYAMRYDSDETINPSWTDIFG